MSALRSRRLARALPADGPPACALPRWPRSALRGRTADPGGGRARPRAGPGCRCGCAARATSTPTSPRSGPHWRPAASMSNRHRFRWSRIPAELERAHLGVVPTLRDDFTELLLPVKLLEYVHMGLPAIAPRLPVIERYFGDAEVRMFEPGSEVALADALAEVCSDPAAAHERAQRASIRLAEIDWGHQRRGYLELVDRLARKDSPGRMAKVRAVRLRSWDVSPSPDRIAHGTRRTSSGRSGSARRRSPPLWLSPLSSGCRPTTRSACPASRSAPTTFRPANLISHQLPARVADHPLHVSIGANSQWRTRGCWPCTIGKRDFPSTSAGMLAPAISQIVGNRSNK